MIIWDRLHKHFRKKLQYQIINHFVNPLHFTAKGCIDQVFKFR